MDREDVRRLSESVPVSPSEEPISVEKFPAMLPQEMRRLMFSIGLLESIDCAGLAAAFERSHATGPMLDPTAYRAAMERLSPMAELARKAAAAVKALQELRKVMVETEPQAAAYRIAHGAGAFISPTPSSVGG